MQIHPASFPNNRRTDPKRQGELKVYTELSATPTVGLAIYGGKAGPDSPEEDFVLWLHKEVRASVEVKGGETSFEYGQWILHSVHGPELVDSPVIQAKDAAFSFKDAVKEAFGRKVYILSVIVFTDMAPDPAIIQEAERHKVHALFGTSGLVEKILEIAGTREIFVPPTLSHIRNEAQLFVPGIDYLQQRAAEPRTDGDDRECAKMDIAAQRVIIQHVDVVNIYTTGSDGEPLQ